MMQLHLLQQLHGGRISKPPTPCKQMPTASISHLSSFTLTSLRFPSPLFNPFSSSFAVPQFRNVLRLRARSVCAKPITMCKMNDAGFPFLFRYLEQYISVYLWFYRGIFANVRRDFAILLMKMCVRLNESKEEFCF